MTPRHRRGPRSPPTPFTTSTSEPFPGASAPTHRRLSPEPRFGTRRRQSPERLRHRSRTTSPGAAWGDSSPPEPPRDHSSPEQPSSSEQPGETLRRSSAPVLLHHPHAATGAPRPFATSSWTSGLGRTHLRLASTAPAKPGVPGATASLDEAPPVEPPPTFDIPSHRHIIYITTSCISET